MVTKNDAFRISHIHPILKQQNLFWKAELTLTISLGFLWLQLVMLHGYETTQNEKFLKCRRSRLSSMI